jgi:hypothetical protein
MTHQNNKIALPFNEPVHANAVRPPVAAPHKFITKDIENPNAQVDGDETKNEASPASFLCARAHFLVLLQQYEVPPR